MDNQSTRLQNTIVIDARGLLCPHPIAKLKQALKTTIESRQFALLATDPLAVVDVPAFCARYGHHLVHSHYDESYWTFTIQRM